MIKKIKNTKKICRDCHMELPDDSIFCQFCGSSSIGERIYISSTEIIKKCSICGVVPDDSRSCPYCGSKHLYEEDLSKITQNTSSVILNKPDNGKIKTINHRDFIRVSSYTSKDHLSNDYKSSRINFISKSMVFLIIALIIFGLYISFNSIENHTSVEVINGQYIVTTSQAKHSTVTFYNSSSDTCYVFFDCVSHDSSYDIGFIAKPKQLVLVPTPAVSYKIYYAIGNNWYGKDYKFGNDTSYFVNEDLLDCSTGSWKVTFSTNSSNQNILKEINSSVFPG